MRELVKPGMSFEEFAHKAPKLPAAYRNGRYSSMVHQAGLEDEGPGISYPDDARKAPVTYPKRTLRENMVLNLECYAGKDDEMYGVKLEDQVLVTKNGAISLNTYPFEKKLL